MSLSASTAKMGSVNSIKDKRREFDRRVAALSKEYDELLRPGKNAIDKNDIRNFLSKIGRNNENQVNMIFQLLDENKDDLITKYFIYNS